jgi:hypothetical protein
MKPVDWVVMFIALCVGIVVVMPLFSYVIAGEHMSEEGDKLIGGLVASMIAIISIYVGARLKDKD